MKYKLADGADALTHAHPADFKCPWKNIFKPLAFLISQNSGFMERLTAESPTLEPSHYSRWLTAWGEDGLLNLVRVLLSAVGKRGMPETLL